MRINNPWWLNRKIAIATITTTVAIVTTIVRFTGGFETLELKRYDYFWTKRAITRWDERIVIVGYTDSDAKKYGQSPPDKILRQVLEKIERSRATTTGLLYARANQSPTPSERVFLEDYMASMKSLVRSDEQDRFTPEPDNIIRKAQLYKDKKPNSTEQPRHFVFEVAKHYLERKGATIKEDRNLTNPSIQITYKDGKIAKITPLTSFKDGGYSASTKDLTNFQVLISWPFNQSRFKVYSFETILKNQPFDFKNKIVVIGNLAEINRKSGKSPVFGGKETYTYRYTLEYVGIIISNFLQQAENPFVQVWRDPIEYLYFYLWMLISGFMIWWLCEELDPEKKWVKYLFSSTFTWITLLFSIWTISFWVFPKLWIPSVFIWRGVTFNMICCTLACLELKAREEQNKRLESQSKIVEEQQKRIKEKESLEEQQELEIQTLKNTVFSQERLAFIGRLSPFLNHKIINLQNDLELNISNSELDLRDLEDHIYDLLDLLIDILEEEEADDKKESILDLLQTLRKRCSNERKVLQRTNELLEKFLPKIRTKNSEYSNAELLNINRIIQESSSISDYDFKSFHINFSVTIELQLSDHIPLIYGLSSELQFALVNIIENAYYAVWEKSQISSSSYIPIIKISSSVFQDRVIISVEDNGVGIDKDKQQSIFNPFYSTKKRFQGMSGVGLTLTKDILEQYYNGKIYLDTHHTHTCFVIEIPYPSVQD